VISMYRRSAGLLRRSGLGDRRGSLRLSFVRIDTPHAHQFQRNFHLAKATLMTIEKPKGTIDSILFTQGKQIRVSVLVALITAAGVVIAAIITLYNNWQEQNQEATKDARTLHETYLNAIVDKLQRQYVAPKLRVDLPMMTRSNEAELNNMLDSVGVYILVGPSNSGKTTTLQQLVNGHSATIYVSMKENIFKREEDLKAVIGTAFGCANLSAAPLADLSLQDVLNKIKEALQSEPVKKFSPLFILDDVQKFCVGAEVHPDAAGFLTWCQEMCNLGLMNFIMISSDQQAVEPLQKLSGFAARLKVIGMPYVLPEALVSALQTSALNEKDAKFVVDHLGSHMGDISAFLQNRKNGMSVQGAVDSIVAESVARLSNVFSQRPPDVEEKLWNGVARALFEAVTDNTAKVVSLVKVQQYAAKYVKDAKYKDVKKVAESLASLNILRFVDFKTVAFHRPVYGPAFNVLQQDDSFKATVN